MTHDEVVEFLTRGDGWHDGEPRAEPGAEPRAEPGAESNAVRAHAVECADCAALLDALALAAVDERAVADEPPPGYWETFDARLDARLPRVPLPQVPVPRVPQVAAGAPAATSRSALRRHAARFVVAAAAAGLALVALLGVLARRPAGMVASGPETASLLAASAPSDVEAAIAALEPADWGVESMAGTLDALDASASVQDGALAVPGGLDDSFGALEDELAVSLDEAGQRELARRLREAS